MAKREVVRKVKESAFILREHRRLHVLAERFKNIRKISGRDGTMIVVEQTFELAIGASPSTRYVLERQLEDGRVVLRPQTELEAMRERAGSRALTRDEFDELIAPHLLPADSER